MDKVYFEYIALGRLDVQITSDHQAIILCNWIHTKSDCHIKLL